MYDGETVRRALAALAEGMTQSEAAALCGVTRQTVRNWAAGRVPRGRARGATMVPRTRREEAPVDDAERAAYEAAMTENQLLRAVLDDLKGGGSHPGSMSNRRKCARRPPCPSERSPLS